MRVNVFFFSFLFQHTYANTVLFFPNETEIFIFNQKDGLAIILYSLTQ